ncbi:MAG: modification methylase [Rhodobacteraceae bacterium]|nr:modification methylase [Paracoccaceae bacterium]
MPNGSLTTAKKSKYDEFYTQLSDIEKEMFYYKDHFRGKTIYCNCDDPRVSNFWQHFSMNFEHYGLHWLVSSCYKSNNGDLFSKHDTEDRAVWLDYDGFRDGETMPRAEDIERNTMSGDGDFRSQESIDLLEQADIVVTNPPFSLWKEYIAQLIQYDKKFIILGNMNVIGYRDVFPLIRDNKVWLGISGIKSRSFNKPDGTVQSLGITCWFTNLSHKKRNDFLPLMARYRPENYPRYDNYDAIEVSKTRSIPYDYDGVMGVPISFLDKYCPEQFEILGITETTEIGYSGGLFDEKSEIREPMIDGRKIYVRLFIRNRNPE